MCDVRKSDMQFIEVRNNSVTTTSGVSRRHFLATVPAMVLAGRQLLHAAPTQAAPTAAPATTSSAKPSPNRIDVHFHMLPPEYVKSQRERILEITAGDASLLGWTPAKALETMDRFGIATAMMSLPYPGAWLGDVPMSRKMSRLSNDYAAELARNHPRRIGFFAAVPLPDTEGSLKEIEYAFDTLKADGVGLNTSYGDKWPGDPAFAPVFEELNRRQAVAFFHPTAPNCCGSLIPGVAASTVEFVFDTTRAITSLLANGTSARFPNVKFVFCHSGGTMPPVAVRLSGYIDNKFPGRNPQGAMAEIRKLYYDIANATSPAPMAALLALVPATQIVFGTDYPYRQVPLTTNGWDRFQASEELRRAIDRGNALRLFPRLRGAGE